MTEQEQGTWLYAGERFKKGERCHAWLPLPVSDDSQPENYVLLYSYVKGSKASYIPGSEYLATYSKDGGRTTLYGQPEYYRRHDDETLRAWCEAMHQRASTERRKALIEASDKRQSAIDNALKPLMEVAARMPMGDREAFIAYISGKLRKAWK